MARPGHQRPSCLALPPVLCEPCAACCCYQPPFSAVLLGEPAPTLGAAPPSLGCSRSLRILFSRPTSLGKTKTFMTSFISDASCAHSLGQVNAMNPISQRGKQTQRGQRLHSRSHSMCEAEIGQLAPAYLLGRSTKICDAGLQGGRSEGPRTQTLGGQIDISMGAAAKFLLLGDTPQLALAPSRHHLSSSLCPRSW